VKKPDVPCVDCGKLLMTTKSSLPAGQRKCQACRRAAWRKACDGCGEYFTRRKVGPRAYCTIQCANKAAGAARSLQDPNSSKFRYTQRRAAAPGLSYSERERLLQKWKQQGRSCVYCPAPATSMDHVVPLIRGGTNFEGNLAPVCRPCNSSKREWLLTEWRTGRRCTRTAYIMPSPPPQPRPGKPKTCKVSWRTCKRGHWYTAQGKRRCGCPYYIPRAGPRTLICRDCSEPFEHTVYGQGAIPFRCAECRQIAGRAAKRREKAAARQRKQELFATREAA
jgi:hypothetical protein